MTATILIVFAAWNLVVFLVYGADKLKAKKESWRVPEKTLLLLALFFGGTGALLGMGAFHHKTQKPRFQTLVPLLTLLNYICLAALLLLANRAGRA